MATAPLLAIESGMPAQERPQAGPLLPGALRGIRPAAAEADHNAGFDEDSVKIRLSEAAKAAVEGAAEEEDASLLGAFAEARDAGLAALGREAETVLGLFGLTPAEAREGADALAGAVRAATESPAFRAELDEFVAARRPEERENGFSYRASLVVEEAAVVWDPEAGRFVASVRRVALSLEVESGRLVPRGSRQDLDADGRSVAVIRFDAVLPLDIAADRQARRAAEDDRPGREAAGPTP